MCFFPAEMLISAKTGLMLWYSSVLPSVLPFLIISNVCIEIGVVSRLGRMLEPVMRPLFNVPGSGAFAWLMGCVSGYPVGAKITSDFREKGLLTNDEACRLISFSNNPGPLFMLGAVGTSILGSPAAGYFIMVTNYASSIVVGLLFRFYRTETPSAAKAPKRKQSIREHTSQTFGAVLGVSVKRAVEVTVQIGGFIILFSAFIKILELSNFTAFITIPLSPIFTALGANENLIAPFVGGIFEMTNGVKMAGEASAPFSQKVIVSGVLVSFGGLSIFAQTASFISKTDIPAATCMLAKILHAFFQLIIMVLAYPFFSGYFN